MGEWNGFRYNVAVRRKITMDTAKKFKPNTILLWRKVAEHPEARRILGLFPSAQVRLVERQRGGFLSDMSPSQALLTGKRTLMIGETSSFVGRFDGQLGSNVYCCPYYKLVPVSNGCPYYCTYCYLAYVYRKFAPFIKININFKTMFKQIRKALNDTDGNVSFNMGEMLDSLALDHVTHLTTRLVPFFDGFKRAFLMLLTKSINIENLLSIEPSRQTVISWSLNSQSMIEKYELGTASLDERIEAARKCREHGYRIRFRIDPGILYSNWREGYTDLIQKALEVVQPENITIGILRLLPGHFKLASDTYGKRARELWSHNFVRGASDGKLRYPSKERVKFYTFLIDVIRSFNKNISIGLCRETTEISRIFKDRCHLWKCNCVI